MGLTLIIRIRQKDSENQHNSQNFLYIYKPFKKILKYNKTGSLIGVYLLKVSLQL